MRILLKILLFPIILVLSIAVATSRFLCEFSCILLSILSAIIFLIAVLALLILKDPLAALNAGIIALVISPYGIPKLANWLIDRLENLNFMLKSI